MLPNHVVPDPSRHAPRPFWTEEFKGRRFPRATNRRNSLSISYQTRLAAPLDFDPDIALYPVMAAGRGLEAVCRSERDWSSRKSFTRLQTPQLETAPQNQDVCVCVQGKKITCWVQWQCPATGKQARTQKQRQAAAGN